MCYMTRQELLELPDGEKFRMKMEDGDGLCEATKIVTLADESFIIYDVPEFGEAGEGIYLNMELVMTDGEIPVLHARLYDMEACCD